MRPRLRNAVTSHLHDSPVSSHLPETEEPEHREEVPVKTTEHPQDSHVTTRSGRQVRKPERLIEHCVIVLLTRDPMGLLVLIVSRGHPGYCV